MSGLNTTLKAIRAERPCGMQRLPDGQRVGYLKLRHHLGVGYGDTRPISVAQVLDSNDVLDALWCLRAVRGCEREMRLFAVWCARQIAHLMRDPRSLNALDVTERYANGKATADELTAARLAAMDAAKAAEDADQSATKDTVCAAWAAWDTAAAVAWVAAEDAAWAARADEATAWAAQVDELRRICSELDAGLDPYPQALSPAGAETTTTGSAA